MKRKLTSIFIAVSFALALNAQVGIGTSTPNGSAILHLSSTGKGFLPPVMTTTNRDNISTPAPGLLIFNSTENKLNVNNGAWYSLPLSTSGAAGITLGAGSGASNQAATAIALGQYAGNSYQSSDAISIGKYAGYQNQAANSTAIGYNAGYNSQNYYSLAIGNNAGMQFQGMESIAIGKNSGYTYQGTGAIALGTNAGNNSQGSYSIAIGTGAGNLNQAANSIVLSALGGSSLNASASGFYVAPIRSTASTNPTLMYNTSTYELQYSASDARLKNNIQPLTSGLDEVMRLQPVSFNYRESVESSDYNGHNIGFIAQQVKEVIPEAVITNPDSLLGINTTTMIPVLVKAIQELKEENQILAAKVAQLQNKKYTRVKLLMRRRR